MGVFGGTFNPVHYGHLRAAEETCDRLGLERILFIPSGTPPLKTLDIAPASHRFEMTRIAAAGNRRFEVLDVECRNQGKSYTVNTLLSLLELYDQAELFFILGVDAFLDLPHWWQPEKLLSLTNFIVLSRPGQAFLKLSGSPFVHLKKKDLEQLDRGETGSLSIGLSSGKQLELLRIPSLEISSSYIRTMVRSGRSIRYLVPAKVEKHILSHGLYR